jgi:sugar lactone lactonase YvrE
VGVATSSHLNQPDAIAVDGAGNVYIADYGNDVVEKVTPGGQLSVIAGIAGAAANPTAGPATSSHLSQADGVAVDAAGNVYIVDGGANVVAKVTPGGALSVAAGISGTSAQPTPGTATASALDDPNGVAVDAAGAVYVADAGAHVIEKITPAGQLSVIAGSGAAGHPVYGGAATATSLDLPLAMVVDPTGTVYVADALNFTIDRLTPPAPMATGDPAITGSPQAGQTLTGDQGSWDNAPFAATYQWQDCDLAGANCTAISEAISATYAVTAGDSGHTIRVVVTATNGGGSAVSSSAPTAPVPDAATPTPTPTGTPAPTAVLTPPLVPVLATTTPPGSGTADPPTIRSATLTGEVSASSTPITVYFQYGTDASYGGTTLAQTLPASDVAQAVGVLLPDLIPGTVYHYHLVAGTGSGTSVGQDVILTTPKATLSRVRDRITPVRGGRAPYRFRVQGSVVPPAGVTRSVACRSGGAATVTVTRNGKTLATHRVHVQRDCTYDGTIAFTRATLPAHGHLQFHLGFAGNRQLNAHPAHMVDVVFGAR